MIDPAVLTQAITAWWDTTFSAQNIPTINDYTSFRTAQIQALVNVVEQIPD